MLHSTLFATSEAYRRDNFDEHPSDRPLVVQFCGDDPETLLAAARYVEGRCDAVDLNCGCPQAIARRGHYGAFLLDEPELIEAIVRTLANALSVPVRGRITSECHAQRKQRHTHLVRACATTLLSRLIL